MTTGAILPERAQGAAPVLRQQVLVLYLATSALDSPVVGWSLYDGTGRTSPTTGDSDEPPYESGVAALPPRAGGGTEEGQGRAGQGRVRLRPCACCRRRSRRPPAVPGP